MVAMNNKNLEAQRQSLREAMMQLQPPTSDEILRTVFIGGLTEEGVGHNNAETERVLAAVGGLRRWIRPTDSSGKPCRFGFAEYEDPESLKTAVEVLKDLEIPTKQDERPSHGSEGEKKEVDGEEGNGGDEKKEDKNGDVEDFGKSKLLVLVDEATQKYIHHWEENSQQDPSALPSRVQAARSAVDAVITSLLNPPTVDSNGDVYMTPAAITTGERNEEIRNAVAEITSNVPPPAEDELSDIPPEMRVMVAKEIAAFRDRSNQRDLERLRREEEVESLDRTRGFRNRLASPPPSAPSGPASANGIPVGPRHLSGPVGFGAQIPRDYQKGVTFVNNEIEDEETDASDEELERRRQKVKDEELEKQFLDQERRWLNRERGRAAAMERDKNRSRDEEARHEKAKQAMARKLQDWNDDLEVSRKFHDYYSDHGAWLRNRTAFRAHEVSMDDSDRAIEEREKAQYQQNEETARGMADDFLARQAEEMHFDEPGTSSTQQEPQRFKLSLGAAAQQKAQQQSSNLRRHIELEEEEEDSRRTKRRAMYV